jgi:hypothetical protein
MLSLVDLVQLLRKADYDKLPPNIDWEASTERCDKCGDWKIKWWRCNTCKKEASDANV